PSSYFNYQDLINTIGGNTHSVSFMPNFVSDTDLHTNSALLYEKGTPLAEITTDIDNDIRNNPPCIGADEFTNPNFNINDTILCYYNQYFQELSYIYDIGYGYNSYQWSNGSDSSSIVIDTANTTIGNNTYTVTVTVGTNTYSDTVNIFYDKPAGITQTDYCYWNSPVVITANPGFVSYEWSSGDTTQTVVYNSGGYYPHLIVTDTNGCKSEQDMSIAYAQFDYSPYGNYPANFNLSDTAICNNQSLLLNANQYTDPDAYNHFIYQWSTSDTTQSLTIDSNSFVPGNYALTATVFLEANQLCASTDTINITITDCSGIDDLDHFDFVVYPNPAHSKIIIDGKKPDAYKLLSLAGILLQEKTISSMPKTIDVSNLLQGIYLLKLQFGNYFVVRKIVIN
ncbi:MAG: T9SS type A sorting domain-containing protein, partial [Bacteroidales bacterium]|nr:T9SS type A sorting domain-containing protein [Bacteroidales bacterium]